MNIPAAAIRKRVRELVNELPASELATAERILRGLLVLSQEDPVARAIENAPLDEKPVSEETLQRIRKAQESVKAGRVVSFAEALNRPKQNLS